MANGSPHSVNGSARGSRNRKRKPCSFIHEYNVANASHGYARELLVNQTNNAKGTWIKTVHHPRLPRAVSRAKGTTLILTSGINYRSPHRPVGDIAERLTQIQSEGIHLIPMR